MKEAAAEKDVETTVTPSNSSDKDTGTAKEGTSDDEEDTQSEESDQIIPLCDKEKESEKPLNAEKGKGEDVVDVETYETTKPTERTGRGMTKRLRSSSGKTILTTSKTPAPRVKTTGVGPVKGWSKVFAPTSKKKENLKRKKESSSDSDYDVAEDVPNISSPTPKTKATAKKVPQNVEEASCDNIYQRRLAVERELTKDALKCQDIFHYIKEARRSVEPKAELEVPNDVVSSEITAGKVKVWPKNKLIPTSKLNVKYAILNRIGSTNWVPTKHATNVATGLGRFIYVVGTKVDYDYGSFIFDQTVKHIRSTAVKMPIAFPSLLSRIILDQYPDIKVVTDTPKKRETAFTFHHKLFGDHNVADHVGTSASGASPMTKVEIIAALKVQCREIDK
ncbi:unnamed protein product [Trifolium pratense]|uniref:Uncharacterized protein n=1 Tax=Trifolium pratense TaxID=57577 RepID=A0ACB0KIS1_TRIPR|nr:unnamed protein product [Trifolium pratense]